MNPTFMHQYDCWSIMINNRSFSTVTKVCLYILCFTDRSKWKFVNEQKANDLIENQRFVALYPVLLWAYSLYLHIQISVPFSCLNVIHESHLMWAQGVSWMKSWLTWRNTAQPVERLHIAFINVWTWNWDTYLWTIQWSFWSQPNNDIDTSSVNIIKESGTRRPLILVQSIFSRVQTVTLIEFKFCIFCEAYNYHNLVWTACLG